MNSTEFMKARGEYVAAMRAYLVEIEKTSTMLAECGPEPPNFIEGFRVMSQVIAESDAQSAYLAARGLLFEAARLAQGQHSPSKIGP
jgi:hypothetical protein